MSADQPKPTTPESSEIAASQKAIRSLSTPSRYALSDKFHLGALLSVCFLVFFLNLGTCRLWDEDEPRNAGCAAEMLQRSDWIVPTFNDELRPQKPILIYWLMMFSYQVIGQNEWGARFWSAVFGTGTVLLTYRTGKRMFCPSVGFWAGLVLASNIMFTVASRAATPDALLIFFSTLAIYLYVRSTFSQFEPDRLETFDTSSENLFPSIRSALPIFIAMGFGVLAKGPIAVVLPCMILGLFQLIIKSNHIHRTATNENPSDKKLNLADRLSAVFGVFHVGRFLTTLRQMNPLAIAGVVLAISAPWYFLVGYHTDWEFLRIFFLRENLERATTGMENHTGGIWFHPAALQVVFFPWSLLTLPAIFCFWRIARDPDRYRIWYPGIILATVWIGLQITVFSAVQTKLPSYVTPCYPALSLLWGVYLHRITRGEKFHPVWFLAGVFFLMATVGIGLYVGIGYYLKTPPTTPTDGLVIGLPLIIAAIFGFWIGLRKGGRWFSAVMGGGSVAFIVTLFAFGTNLVDQYRHTEHLWTHLSPKTNTKSALAAYGSFCSTWVYYSKRPIYEIQVTSDEQHKAEISNNLQVDAETVFQKKEFWHRKARPTLRQFLKRFPQGQILVADNDWESLQKRLPYHYKVLDRQPFFREEQFQGQPRNLLLVGPPNGTSKIKPGSKN